MKALNYPIIAFTCTFIAGLLLGFIISFDFKKVSFALGSVALIFFLLYFWKQSTPIRSGLFGFVSFLLMLLIGIFIPKFYAPENNLQHYLNSPSLISNSDEQEVLLQGKVIKPLNFNKFSNKYIIELSYIGKHPIEGMILLNIEKDSLSKKLKTDDIVAFFGSLQQFHPPRNKYQFDYKSFMENRGVFRQIYCRPNEVTFLKNERSVFGLAERVRKAVSRKLSENGFSKNQMAMIQALLLGQTNGISDQVYDSYKAAGVVHILSVSGLHVGFVLLIFDFLLKFLTRFRYGKILKVVLLIILMWAFALLAGFSAAVVRSVTMFSFVAVGLNLGRKTQLINILFMSLLAILLFEPHFIFELGFQLSYLAVFSIVIFQPLIYALYKPPNKLVKLIWGTATVSLAAQIGVFPLILFYFHQFPGLFLFANLVIIPLVGIILAFVIGCIVLAFLGILPPFLTHWIGESIDFLNSIVAWFAGKEYFLIQNIRFSKWEMLGCYGVLLCVILLIRKPSYKKIWACGLAFSLLLGILIFEKHQNLGSAEFMILYKNRKSILVKKTGNKLLVFHNLEKEHFQEEYKVKNILSGKGIENVSGADIKNVYFLGNEILLTVDSSGVYQLPTLKNCYVLLRESPRINLIRLIQILKPKQIIADGSNYKSYVERWKKTCMSSEIPFHNTREDGVFIIQP